MNRYAKGLLQETGKENAAFDLVRRVFQSYVLTGRPNLVMATLYMSRESVTLAKLLNSILSEKYDSELHWLSFFCNSRHEAFSASVKLARHNVRVKGGVTPKSTVVFDRNSRIYNGHTDIACDTEGHDGIVPGLSFVNTLSQLKESILSGDFGSVYYVSQYENPIEERKLLSSISALCKDRSIYLTIDESQCDLQTDRLLSPHINVDCVTLGDNLSGGLFPIGVMIARSDYYRVWDDFMNCLLHSSTFGGNAIACAISTTFLSNTLCGNLTSQGEAVVIERNDRWKDFLFETLVNPQGARNYQMVGLDVEFCKARGISMWTKSGVRILDCTGNYGCSLRGHNNEDVLRVVARNDLFSHSWATSLEAAICKEAGLDCALFSVSGATAVDSVLMIARSANPAGRKILSFKGNYSGKTLASMNLSLRSPILRGSDREAFTPHTTDIVYVDPNGADAEDQLKTHLAGGDVFLVWFELIQGSLCQPIQQNLIDIVQEYREAGGYLIGVDEVLTGYWRMGSHFLASQKKGLSPDLVTLGKQMSDMMVPIGALLTTKAVKDASVKNNSRVWQYFHEEHTYPATCAIALHGFTEARSFANSGKLEKRQTDFLRGLQAITAQSTIFEEHVEGEGNLLRINLKKTAFPFSKHRTLMHFLEQVTSTYLLEKSGVLAVLLRFNLPLIVQDDDVNQVLTRFSYTVSRTSPFTIYSYAMKLGVRYFRKRLRIKTSGYRLTTFDDNRH